MWEIVFGLTTINMKYKEVNSKNTVTTVTVTKKLKYNCAMLKV